MSVGQETTRHKNSGLPLPKLGGQQNEKYYNSLDQMAAAVQLSPVYVHSDSHDSELEIHFNGASSVAAQLSPELIILQKVSYMDQGLCDRSSRKTNSWTKCLVNAYLRVF